MIHKTAENEEVQGYGWPKGSLQSRKKNLKFNKLATFSLRKKSINM